MLSLALACSNEPTAPAIPEPTPEPPSQTAAEAKRDGVPEQVAKLTLSDRLRIAGDGASTSVTSNEGVWVIARPPAPPEYGEVLLLDSRRRRIEKAFPLPGAPPYHLAITDEAVYCGRSGDGGLPNTSVCRIDRTTHNLTVRIFWCDDCVDATERPKSRRGWSVSTGSLPLYALEADDDGVWAKDFHEGNTWTRLDPGTLEVVERKVVRATPKPS